MPKPHQREPVPEDNPSGHHPDHDQDKPVERFRQRAAAVAAQSHARRGSPRARELQVDGLAFRGLAAGREAGELVVMLHGFPQTSAAWSAVMARLAAEGYHLWAPDQRGYSPGARPDGIGAYRLEHLVQDVLGMAERLGSPTLHLVGHDWGGVVAWAAAAAHPERIRSLAVLSTPHPRALASSLWRSDQLLRSSYVGLFVTPRLPEVVLGAGGGVLLRALLRRSGLEPEQVDLYADAMIRQGGLGPALNWYRALLPSLARTGTVPVPTLYLWGEKDPALGAAAAQATGRFVRGRYRFEVIRRGGHWLPERHAEEVGQLLVEHLADRMADPGLRPEPSDHAGRLA